MTTFSRRSILQLFGAVGVATAFAERVRVSTTEPVRAPIATPIQLTSEPAGTPTKLETFLRRHRIKPAHLARESGYSRQHLLRLRMGWMLPTKTCAANIAAACRRLTRERVRARDLFDHCLPDLESEE
jgi:hypothetical protein